jgi:hypothetical protein
MIETTSCVEYISLFEFIIDIDEIREVFLLFDSNMPALIQANKHIAARLLGHPHTRIWLRPPIARPFYAFGTVELLKKHHLNDITKIDEAIYHGNIPIIEYLVNAGADVRPHINEIGHAIAHYIPHENQVQFLNRMIDLGADVANNSARLLWICVRVARNANIIEHLINNYEITQVDLHNAMKFTHWAGTYERDFWCNRRT